MFDVIHGHRTSAHFSFLTRYLTASTPSPYFAWLTAGRAKGAACSKACRIRTPRFEPVAAVDTQCSGWCATPSSFGRRPANNVLTAARVARANRRWRPRVARICRVRPAPDRSGQNRFGEPASFAHAAGKAAGKVYCVLR